MPEGDTVHKLADYLGPELAGRAIVTGVARTERAVDLAGSRIVKVFARGKHLFIEINDNRLLRSHLGMWGSWHGYAPGESWQKPRAQASIVLDTGERVFVCFNARQVEILRCNAVRQRRLTVALGPDLLTEPVDYAQILIRARSLAADTQIPDVLLEQRVAGGIGNVYKSEVLFLQGCNPTTVLGNLTDDHLRQLYRQASRLLRRNTGGGPRVTRWSNDAAGYLWVYGRRGQPCLRCNDVIRSAKLGRRLRSTYWCPSCQAEIC